jgi:hypothetical protein
MALGQATVEHGQVTFDMEAFLNAVAENQFAEQEALVEVGNRSYTNKAGQEVVDDSPIRFAAVS